MKISKPEYIAKALLLNEDERQKIMSRMSGKLPKRLLKEKLSVEEAVAIQLEIEEEQLAEWRKNWEKIRKQDGDKKSKAKSKHVAEAAQSSVPVAKPKVARPASKAKAVAAPAKPARKRASLKAKITKTS